MPGKIFVNYRRDDERAFAARVRDRLAQAFGGSGVFMDVDNLMAGQRFDLELEKALAETDVFLAVMGPRWMDLYQKRQATGERDYVHEEIAGALKRGITVVPVLIEGATLPRGDLLPEDIRELVLHQKHGVTHENFGRDVAGLIEAIKFARRNAGSSGKPDTPPIPWGWVGGTAAVVSLVGWIGAYQVGVPVWVPWSPPQRPSASQPTKEQFEAVARQAALREHEAKAQAERERATREKAARDAAAKKQADDAARAAAAEKLKSDEAAAAKKADDEAALKQKAEAERQQRERAAAAPAAAPKTATASSSGASSGSLLRGLYKPPDLVAALVPGSGQSASDCWNDGVQQGCGPEMVVVPAGRFRTGEGNSSRNVAIQQPFAVGKFEVTFDEWAACVASGGCTSNRSPDDRGWGKGRRPVINVSWIDAKEYIAWLSRKTDQSYRLLTEAEWEYAARAGTTTRYSWGDDIGKDNANCARCGSQWDNKQTAPAGSFKPNPWGLHDMHGNVEEWCEDAYDSTSRVVRGGSWFNFQFVLYSSARSSSEPVTRNFTRGFRVARVLYSARSLQPLTK